MQLKDILVQVEKPARYAGGEFNTPNMDKPCSARFCLCFPEIYEIGMSNIGMRILYHMLNEESGVVCERSFAPQQDMAKMLKEANLELFSLETKRPLKDFDVVGFSIGYEMLYTNVLYMLDLANIPFYAKDRGEEYPILIAGGPCAVNPEPFARFFDAVMIGEGEVNLAEFAKLYKECKAQGLTKKEFLDKARSLEGVYVPDIDPSSGGVKVKRAVAKDLDNAYFPTKIIVPNMEITHDRAVLELYRGCSNGCRFCQACFYYRPIRSRSRDTLIRYGKELMANTGYDEISLASLSTSDYEGIVELIQGLKEEVCNKRVRLSMPSLRLDTYKEELMGAGRKGSLTFAPEAGTQRLRDVINKNISDDNIRETITHAIKNGYTGVKLYFMLGLPTETEDDLQGIVDIVKLIKQLAYEYGNKKKPFNITVSTSVFIPKPLTPFQWERQISVEEMHAKQQFLKDNLRIKNVRYNWHDSYTSLVEAALARGDRRLDTVLVKAYEMGAKFDGWSERFNYAIWQKAFSECGVDMADYTREIGEEEYLPWSFIDNGVTEKYLLTERRKAYTATVTPACNKNNCHACGAKKLGRCFE